MRCARAIVDLVNVQRYRMTTADEAVAVAQLL